MSSIGELISQLKAQKQAADELEADIARANALADELIEQTSAIGFESKASQIREAEAKAEQAQHTRRLAEGHLESAIAILQAVIDGQKGSGTRAPGGAADQHGSPQSGGTAAPSTDSQNDDPQSGPEDSTDTEPADEASYVIEWDGIPVKIIPKAPDPEHEPGPTGEELLQDSEDRPRKLRSFRTAARDAARNLADIKDAGKAAAQTHWDATHTHDARPAQMIPEVGYEPSPSVFRAPPEQGVTPGDVVGNSLVWAVGAAMVITKLKKTKEDEDGR